MVAPQVGESATGLGAALQDWVPPSVPWQLIHSKLINSKNINKNRGIISSNNDIISNN